MNAVFLGTVGHLAPSISSAFTSGMGHAFLASAFICVLAIFCSLVRGNVQRVPVAAPQGGVASTEGGDGVQLVGKR
jgi:hypothetical protein